MQPKMIRVDQALHGYSRGHKELAISVDLDEQSRATMLMMSDLLAVSGLRSHESYLTIYPIKSASRHVIARTWPAEPNYRPGSVWTHSLILDYQALTLINDLVSLLSYFEIPAHDAHRSYGRQLAIDANDRSNAYVRNDKRIGAALRQLYGSNPRRLVTVSHLDAECDEILTLAIWRQMWPGMRRNFAALTNAGDGTVPFDSDCTLRFTRNELLIDDETDPDIEEGLQKLEADLPEPGPTPLRTFLGRYAIEGREPRRLAAALASSRIDAGHPASLRIEKLRRLAEGASLPRLTRDLLNHEFARVRNSSALLSLVQSARDEIVDVDLTQAIRLASAMSLEDLSRLISATRRGIPESIGARLYADLIDNLPLDRLAHVADRDELLRIAELRPEILYVRNFWPSDDALRAKIVEDLAPGALRLTDAFNILGRSIGPRTASALIRNVDLAPDTAISLLNADETPVRDAAALWVVTSPERLRAVAKRWRDLDRRGVETLAGAQLGQEGPPRDPQSWAMLIVKVIAEAPSRIGALNAVGYLCSLALSGDEALGLARSVFDPVNLAVRMRSLSRAEESYLSGHIAAYSESKSLSKALLQSALSKWPVTSTKAGVFGITRSEAVQDELVDEIMVRTGKSGLEAALRCPDLPSHARSRIEHLLTPPKKPQKNSNPWAWLFGE